MTKALRVLLHNDETASLAAKLKSAFQTALVSECNDYETLPELIESHRPDVVYTVRFSGTPGYPREALFAPDGPRWVSNGGVGVDHFGIWDTGRTTVTNAAGVAAHAMAEFVIGSFLHFALDVAGLRADKKMRLWRARKVRPLHGKTLAIVGLGKTGQALASRAKAFGMYVIGTRSSPQQMENIDEVRSALELPNLLPRADFVAVCVPLTDQTRRLIGGDEIAAMKPGVIIADVSRGGVIDQSALQSALVSGHVAGAALDVFETEPLPTDSALWDVENLIISPHCSSVYDGWQEASFDLFLENLDRWSKGLPLDNVVDPIRGY